MSITSVPQMRVRWSLAAPSRPSHTEPSQLPSQQASTQRQFGFLERASSLRLDFISSCFMAVRELSALRRF